MRTLLYGGSFNPPHLGHVDAVRAALAQGWAERVLVMPTAESPHKELPLLSPAAGERYELCRLAFASVEGAEVSDLELRRGGKSYTADTIAALQALYPRDEIGILMGTDMFLTLESWYQAEELFAECHILVLPREENELPLLRAKCSEYLSRHRAYIQLVEKPPLPLSSTQVRERLPERGGTELLPDAVYAEIIRRRFYGARPDLAWLRQKGYELLKPKRVPHVQGCEELAVAMAARWGEDTGRAAEAAILHDCTKKLGYDRQIELCGKYGIELDDIELANEQLLHSKTGAYYARDRFGLDEEAASAIFWHTTGRPGMTVLEKILYLADAAEPNRTYPGAEELRRLCMEDLDAALKQGLVMSLETIKKRGQTAHPMSREALSYLLEREKNGDEY